MRDEEIEALLRSSRPRGMSEKDRRRVIEGILAAGGRRRGAWWQRPVPLWQAAAVFVLAAAAPWIGSLFWTGSPRSGADDVIAATIPVRSTFAPVDPVVFRGEGQLHTRSGDVGAWQVLTPSTEIQPGEEE